MAWGNWDVRVYAASSLMALARRFADQRPEILDRLEACLTDPTPTVRLQVAQSLNALWDIDRDRMWALVTYVAEHEDDHGVLGFFISGPLQRFAGADADRCERLLSTVSEPITRKGRQRRKSGDATMSKRPPEIWSPYSTSSSPIKTLGLGLSVGSMIWCAAIHICGRCCQRCAASFSSDTGGRRISKGRRCVAERRTFLPP